MKGSSLDLSNSDDRNKMPALHAKLLEATTAKMELDLQAVYNQIHGQEGYMLCKSILLNLIGRWYCNLRKSGAKVSVQLWDDSFCEFLEQLVDSYHMHDNHH